MLTELSCDAALVSLAPGQSASCTGVGAATQAQLDAGTVPNTAQVVGEAASGDPRNPADASQDLNGDGYTHIEDFIHGLDPRAPQKDWRDLKNNIDPLAQ